MFKRDLSFINNCKISIRDCLETRFNLRFQKNQFVLLKIIFFMFSDRFDMLNSKIIFKKYIILIHF